MNFLPTDSLQSLVASLSWCDRMMFQSNTRLGSPLVSLWILVKLTLQAWLCICSRELSSVYLKLLQVAQTCLNYALHISRRRGERLCKHIHAYIYVYVYVYVYVYIYVCVTGPQGPPIPPIHPSPLWCGVVVWCLLVLITNTLQRLHEQI